MHSLISLKPDSRASTLSFPTLALPLHEKHNADRAIHGSFYITCVASILHACQASTHACWFCMQQFRPGYLRALMGERTGITEVYKQGADHLLLAFSFPQ